MGTLMYLPVLLAALVCSGMAAEKVLFGEPAPISAEGRQATADADSARDTKAKNGGRQARVFVFPDSKPGSQQDSRTHQPAYVISSPYETNERYSPSAAAAVAAAEAADNENRLLSFLPSFGNDGMQVRIMSPTRTSYRNQY